MQKKDIRLKGYVYIIPRCDPRMKNGIELFIKQTVAHRNGKNTKSKVSVNNKKSRKCFLKTYCQRFSKSDIGSYLPKG